MDSEFERRLLGSPSLSPTCSPLSSPVKNHSGDRFIPRRAGATWLQTGLGSLSPDASLDASRSPAQSRKAKDAGAESGKDSLAYQCLLRNELLGAGIEDVRYGELQQASASAGSLGIGGGGGAAAAASAIATGNGAGVAAGSGAGLPMAVDGAEGAVARRALWPRESNSLFQYSACAASVSRALSNDSSPYSLSPVGEKSQRLLRSPRKVQRKIPKVPFKVLDAPELQDDFYLNLVDWSSQNVLSVGLGTCVYLWSACTSQVTRLCDLAQEGDSVTSVAWAERGHLVSVGTHKGLVQIWDVASSKKVRTLEGHTARVGALAWNADLLSSGSRDRLILQHDTRATPSPSGERKYSGHKQEVCGLKWSPDHQHLASGGNDNKLFVWNVGSSVPVQTYSDHIAAVKAIAWSPHQHGLLASGGGTADRCIRFRNTLTGQPLQSVDTGSQVCNLAWSKHSHELVSTHGYSQNQILVWKYPSLVQLAKLTGHTYRVLYLAMSPDGEAIVTGAGDETLRFWNVFSKSRYTKESNSVLNLFNRIR